MKLKQILITIGIIFAVINVIACSGAGVDSSKAEKLIGSADAGKVANTEKPADKTFKIQCLDFAGAAVNPTSGCQLKIKVTLRNSSYGPAD